MGIWNEMYGKPREYTPPQQEEDTGKSLCVNCGHYQFLHEGLLRNECAACDTPEVSMNMRCPAFRSAA